MKKKIIICGVIILIVATIALCTIFLKPNKQSSSGNLENKNQIEVNEIEVQENEKVDVIEESLEIAKQLESMKFSKFEILKTNDDKKKVKLQILNESEETISKETLKLIMTCEDGSIKETMIFVNEILPKETLEAEVTVGKDIENIVDVKIEKF